MQPRTCLQKIKKKVIEAKVEEMKQKLAEDRAKQEAELKEKMIEMKKAGKTNDEIKAFVLSEKKKMAAAALASSGSVSGSQDAGPVYTLDELRKRPKDCDQSKLEMYLSDVDFKKTFSMTKAEFEKVQPWKKNELKKKLQLH